MIFFKEKFVLALFVALLFTIYHSPFTNPVYADSQFQTDYKVTYQIQTDGKTSVTQNIVLKNNTTNFYADKFELKIGSTQVENVKAQDTAGPMETGVKFGNNITTISVKFNQRVIGIGKTLPWTLSYDSKELATKSGEIWEVSIPRVAKSEDVNTYEATLIVPPSFGKLAFAAPEPKDKSQSSATQSFTFAKEQLFASGIAMSFGEKQTFSFDLKYHLENYNLTTQYAEIALPPDNDYQKIVLSSIEPAPLDIAVDADGNFLARYRLGTKEQKDVKATGYVEVFSKPFRNLNKSLSQDQREVYTSPQQYWEVDNGQIRDKAKELKTPKQIYDFVTNYLGYSQERLKGNNVDRKGAFGAYSSPKDSICMEFTDLFIALSRAADIPAREVVGYAYTQNQRLRPLSFALDGKDVLHAWPQYWDDQLGWVQVDPTWGSTSGGLDYFNKMDFNHITFIQRGISSTTPYPPGSFRKQNEDSVKYVNVEFAKDFPESTQNPNLDLSAPTQIISGIPAKISASIRNSGTSSIIGAKLTLTAGKIKILRGNEESIDILPPYAARKFNFTLENASLLSKSQDNLILSFADSQVSRPIKIVPIYFILTTVGFALSVSIAAAVIATGLFLYKRIHLKSLKKHRL